MIDKAGVYIIEGVRGRVYVGSSIRIHKYVIGLRRALYWRKRHSSPRVQQDLDRYGPSAFSITILEICGGGHELLARELYWNDKFHAVSRGYCSKNATRRKRAQLRSSRS